MSYAASQGIITSGIAARFILPERRDETALLGKATHIPALYSAINAAVTAREAFPGSVPSTSRFLETD